MAESKAHVDRIETIEEQRLRASAHMLADGAAQSQFHVPSLHCGGCLAKIETGLQGLPFVKSARANLSTKRVNVLWDPAQGRATAISRKLSDLGFEHVTDSDDLRQDDDQTGKRLLVSLGIAGFAAANIMLLSVSVWSGADEATRHLFHLISGLIAIPAVAFAGRPFFASALSALRRRQLNMDVPISLAVLLAVGMSTVESIRGGPHAYFDAAVMLLFFLLIGRYLDHLMREKARGAVQQISQLAAKGASVFQPDGTQRFVALADIAKGMRLAIAAGERVPVDGVVVAGRSDVDRSLVTGESAPGLINPGETVEAGVLNLSAPLVLEATKTAGQSFLAEVTQMMEAAEQGKSRFVRVADRFARIYAPAVHILALATFAGWLIMTGGDATTALYRAIAVLIITCPCALGLAVPIVHVVGAGRLFRDGVMVKDGAAFEKLNDVDTIVFDKTGTLTLGEPEVVHTSQVPEADMSCAMALAQRSTHPAARGVTAFLGDRAAPCNLEDMREEPGAGLSASLNGRSLRLGNAEWVGAIAKSIPTRSSENASAVYFAHEGEPAVVFELADSLRPGAVSTTGRLKQAGMDLKIFSGDADRPVERVAGELGIDDFKAGLTPGDKIRLVDALQAAGRKVLMIGDGINDAPALAAAHVSMAPSSGSDVGRQAADVVFTQKSLAAVPLAVSTARRIDQLVRQNFALAIIYNCLAVPLAMLGFVTPLVAAIAMSGSSILVVGNSMRLHFGSRRLTNNRNTARGTSGKVQRDRPSAQPRERIA